MPVITPEQAGGANVCAFLDLVAFSEGTSAASGTASAELSTHDGYDVIVAGEEGPEVFTDYSDHPFAHRAPKVVRPGLESTASGRYQVLCRYFEVYKQRLGLPDFGPLSQDRIAIQQIHERDAIPLILSGHIEAAITLCAGIWASMPGNPYGQGGRSMEELLAQWDKLTAQSA
jgi:muramidase (phage lysozyme)